jgi:hypothetical protein
LISAKAEGFPVDPRRWPLKDGHPAVASKRAQVLTYSLAHFMVSTSDIMKYVRIRSHVYAVHGRQMAPQKSIPFVFPLYFHTTAAHKNAPVRGLYGRSQNNSSACGVPTPAPYKHC